MDQTTDGFAKIPKNQRTNKTIQKQEENSEEDKITDAIKLLDQSLKGFITGRETLQKSD